MNSTVSTKHIWPFNRLLNDPLLPLKPLKWIPRRVHGQVLPRILNRVLESQLSDGDFEFLEGRVLGVKLNDLDFGLGVTLNQGRFELASETAEFEATIEGTVGPFIKILTQESDPDTLFFRRQIVIQGDTELGLGVKNILDTLEFEQLPKPIQSLIKGYQKMYFSE